MELIVECENAVVTPNGSTVTVEMTDIESIVTPNTAPEILNSVSVTDVVDAMSKIELAEELSHSINLSYYATQEQFLERCEDFLPEIMEMYKSQLDSMRNRVSLTSVIRAKRG